MSNKLSMHAAARVSHSGTPSYRWQSGAFSSTITDNGAGDLTHTLATGLGVDATEELPMCQRDGAAAASGLTTFGYLSVTDTTKRVTVLQEAALGATSALTDVDYWLSIWKRSP